MRAAAWLLCAGLLAGCADDGAAGPSPPGSPSGSPGTALPEDRGEASSAGSAGPAPGVTLTPRAAVRPRDLDPGTARRTVRHLAGDIGPRLATAPAYRRAARWVQQRFQRWGYRVRRQPVDVPAGDSWGVPVEAGRSVNLVAHRPGVDLSAPHLVVGAHLDTVAVSPGAEDNASGVGTMLAAAEAAADRRTRLPVVWVAFGAEEPRGAGEDDHHYGSRAYVAALSAPQRRAVRGMVSLDRVGVGDTVPVGSPGEQPDRWRGQVLRAARRAGVSVTPGTGERASDHWSFARAGLPGVRVGSTPYAGYHSADDVPAVVSGAQLRRAGRLTLAWLALVP